MVSKSQVISLVAGALLLVIPMSAFADSTASISISGGGSVTVGSTVTATVLESSTQAVNGVKVGVQYDASLLQVVSTTVGNFSTCPAGVTTTGSSVAWQCAALGSQLTGTETVGSVTFKALAAGTATISTTAGTVITDATTANQNDWNGSGASIAYTVTTPVSQSTQSNTNGSSSSTSSNSTNGSVHSTSNAASDVKGTTTGATTSSSTSTTGSAVSTAGAVKGASTNVKSGSNGSAHVTVASTVKTSHAGLIVSSLATVVVVAVAAVWLTMRKRVVVEPKVYKLEGSDVPKRADNKKSKAKTSSKHKTTTRKPSVNK